MVKIPPFQSNRNHDYENFLATLLIKGALERRSAFAVRAFNVEIAKVAGSVCAYLKYHLKFPQKINFEH